MLFGGRRGIRTPGTLSGTPVFKTGAINQLCHSSKYAFLESGAKIILLFNIIPIGQKKSNFTFEATFY